MSERKVIVKLQRPMQPIGVEKTVYVYSEDRSIQFNGNMPDKIAALMGDKYVIFAEAVIGRDGMPDIGDVVPDRDW